MIVSVSLVLLLSACVCVGQQQGSKTKVPPRFIPVVYDCDVYPEIAKMDSLRFTNFMLRKHIPSYDRILAANTDKHQQLDHEIIAIPEGAIQYIPTEIHNRVPLYKYVFWNVDENGNEVEVYHYFAPFKPPASMFNDIIPTTESREGSNVEPTAKSHDGSNAESTTESSAPSNGEQPSEPVKETNDKTESSPKSQPSPTFGDLQSFLPSAVAERGPESGFHPGAVVGDSASKFAPIYIPVLYSSKKHPEIAQMDSLQFTKYMMAKNGQGSSDEGQTSSIPDFYTMAESSVQYLPIDSDNIVELYKCVFLNVDENGNDVPIYEYYTPHKPSVSPISTLIPSSFPMHQQNGNNQDSPMESPQQDVDDHEISKESPQHVVDDREVPKEPRQQNDNDHEISKESPQHDVDDREVPKESRQQNDNGHDTPTESHQQNDTTLKIPKVEIPTQSTKKASQKLSANSPEFRPSVNRAGPSNRMVPDVDENGLPPLASRLLREQPDVFYYGFPEEYKHRPDGPYLMLNHERLLREWRKQQEMKEQEMKDHKMKEPMTEAPTTEAATTEGQAMPEHTQPPQMTTEQLIHPQITTDRQTMPEHMQQPQLATEQMTQPAIMMTQRSMNGVPQHIVSESMAQPSVPPHFINGNVPYLPQMSGHFTNGHMYGGIPPSMYEPYYHPAMGNGFHPQGHFSPVYPPYLPAQQPGFIPGQPGFFPGQPGFSPVQHPGFDPRQQRGNFQHLPYMSRQEMMQDAYPHIPDQSVPYGRPPFTPQDRPAYGSRRHNNQVGRVGYRQDSNGNRRNQQRELHRSASSSTTDSTKAESTKAEPSSSPAGRSPKILKRDNADMSPKSQSLQSPKSNDPESPTSETHSA